MSERVAERDRECPRCGRTARVATEPGEFGMETVTFLGHYVSDAYRAPLCDSVGVPHVQRRIPPTTTTPAETGGGQ